MDASVFNTNDATEAASLPAYYYYDLEDVLPDEWRLLGEEMVI